jgi:hypothetical protein
MKNMVLFQLPQLMENLFSFKFFDLFQVSSGTLKWFENHPSPPPKKILIV